VMDPGFWDICRTNAVTTLPTVPAMLKFMQSIAMEKIPLPSLRKITVSGAAMDESTRSWMVSQIISKRIQVYSMYGMTEATARVAVLPADEFPIRPASVGRPLPHGKLHILPSGEIVYCGPNVMLGYAHDRSDLERADLAGGVLNTGDLGCVDEAGNLYITGRLTRICKLLGMRIDLTDMESQFAHIGDVAVISNDEVIQIFHTQQDESQLEAAAIQLAERWRIPRAALILKRVRAIPRTDSGKIRYPELPEAVAAIRIQ
jgi:acyl-coenzyme A synthetase/AMP-(fatty) acid ligase